MRGKKCLSKTSANADLQCESATFNHLLMSGKYDKLNSRLSISPQDLITFSDKTDKMS